MEDTIIQEQANTQVQEEVKPDPIAEAKAEAAKEIAGLNRRISQMDKALKDSELAKLTEAERAKAEIELAKTERDMILKETAQIKLDAYKEKSLAQMGIPLELAKHLSGNTEEEIASNLKELKDLLDKTVNKKITETTNQLLSGKAPNQSTPPAGTITRAAYEALSQMDKTKVLAAKTKIVN